MSELKLYLWREVKVSSGMGLPMLHKMSIQIHKVTLYQEQAVFGKMKMDPAKRAQTQNAGEV